MYCFENEKIKQNNSVEHKATTKETELIEKIDKLILNEVEKYSKLNIFKKLYNYFSYCRKIDILLKLKNI